MQTRSSSATTRLIETLANNIREEIHKVEEQGVFSILNAAAAIEHSLSNDRSSRAIMRLTSELHEFVSHMLTENEDMVTPTFLIEYLNTTSTYGKNKL